MCIFQLSKVFLKFTQKCSWLSLLVPDCDFDCTIGTVVPSRCFLQDYLNSCCFGFHFSFQSDDCWFPVTFQNQPVPCFVQTSQHEVDWKQVWSFRGYCSRPRHLWLAVFYLQVRWFSILLTIVEVVYWYDWDFTVLIPWNWAVLCVRCTSSHAMATPRSVYRVGCGKMFL